MEIARRNFRYGGATAKVVIDSDGTGVVKNVYSMTKNLGHGTGVMESIIEWAEKNDLVLFLEARPYGRPQQGMTLEALQVFYKKFGFERDPKYPKAVWMFRVPSRYLKTD